MLEILVCAIATLSAGIASFVGCYVAAAWAKMNTITFDASALGLHFLFVFRWHLPAVCSVQTPQTVNNTSTNGSTSDGLLFDRLWAILW